MMRRDWLPPLVTTILSHNSIRHVTKYMCGAVWANAALLGALVAVAVRQLTTSGVDIVAGAVAGATLGAYLAARAERQIAT